MQVRIERRRGRVTAFDDARGLGEITDAAGDRIPFQCIEIADGTRTIAVGQRVRFELHRKLGRPEATSIEPAPDGDAG